MTLLFALFRGLKLKIVAGGSLSGLPGHSFQSTPFPLPNPTEREGRKACRSRVLLAGIVADSMKARPTGEGVQLVAGRNSLISDRDNESPPYVVLQVAHIFTTYCVSGF